MMAALNMQYTFKPLKETQMTQALTLALAIPSRIKRVFDYVKDHPGKTSSYISKALALTSGAGSSVLCDMELRKMLKTHLSLGRDSKGNNRQLKYYTTAILEYELLPKGTKPKNILVPITNSVVKPQTLEQEMSKTLDILLDTLTVKQARELHGKLSRMFAL